MSDPVPFPGVPDALTNPKLAGLTSQYLEPNVLNVRGRLRVLATVKPKRQSTAGRVACNDDVGGLQPLLNQRLIGGNGAVQTCGKWMLRRQWIVDHVGRRAGKHKPRMRGFRIAWNLRLGNSNRDENRSPKRRQILTPRRKAAKVRTGKSSLPSESPLRLGWGCGGGLQNRARHPGRSS